MDFSKLRSAKKGKNSYEDLAAKIAASSGGGFEKDPRYFVPIVDKDGNGLVIMRFLPHAEVDGEDCGDYVELWSHSFKNPVTEQWYIENSRTTLKQPNAKFGENDPVSDANKIIYAELGKDRALKFLRDNNRNRKHNFIANVQILKNDLAPETVGGIYLYKYGQKIHEKIVAKTKKDLEDDVAFDAFNLWEGANFRLKMKKKDDNRNYDDSYFDQPAAHCGGDDKKLEEIYNSLHSLKAEIAPEKFKSYEELEKRYLLVTQGKKQETAENSDVSPEQDEPKSEKKQEEPEKSTKPSEAKKSSYFDEDDDVPF